MDTAEYAEDRYISTNVIRVSPTKIGVIIDEALPEKTDYGQSLICNVSIDAKIKKWRLNKDSVKAMQAVGQNSQGWIGEKVKFTVISVQGKERVIGTPVLD